MKVNFVQKARKGQVKVSFHWFPFGVQNVEKQLK